MTRNEQFELASNENTSGDVLCELSKAEDEKVRSCIAGNKNTPTDILKIFLTDTYDVQIYLALNKNCPTDLLVKLSESNSEIIRNYAIAHERCPIEVIKKCYKEKDALMGIACNISTPLEILEEIYNMDSGAYREFLANNVSTPNIILTLLSKSLDENIRADVAKNSSSTKEIFYFLMDDLYHNVRLALTKNINTPKSILEVLVTDENCEVSKSAKVMMKMKRIDIEIKSDVEQAIGQSHSNSLDDFNLI